MKITFKEDRSFKDGFLVEDTAMFSGRYGGSIVLKGGTRCGFSDKGHFYGELARAVDFLVECEGKKIALSIDRGKKIEFYRDTDRVKGGILRDETEIWPGISFAADEWFEIDLSESGYFSSDGSDSNKEPAYIGGTLARKFTINGETFAAGKPIDIERFLPE